MPGRADRRAQVAGADGARWLHDPSGDYRGALRAPGASTTGCVPGAASVHTRAVLGAAGRDIHMDSVWWGRAEVLGGSLCTDAYEAGDRHGGAGDRPAAD